MPGPQTDLTPSSHKMSISKAKAEGFGGVHTAVAVPESME